MADIDPIALWFLFLFGVFVPYVAWKSNRRLDAGAVVPGRSRIFVNILVMQAAFLMLAAFVAWKREIPLTRLGRFDAASLLLAVGMLALSVCTLPLRWRFTDPARKARLIQARPAAPADLWLWGAVSVAAGVVEEIVFRGVMLALVLPLTGDWWSAVAVCVAAFVLGHNQQGWQRMIVVGLLAFGCHVLVWTTGSLLLAMAVHTLYDFSAGVFHVRLAARTAAERGGGTA
jgi:membrane protease YdiL (CAAX protease family)